MVALGVTLGGEKILLGLQEGHTENSTIVGTLLDNLLSRKLTLTNRSLAVLDGAKALKPPSWPVGRAACSSSAAKSTRSATCVSTSHRTTRASWSGG